MHLYVLLSCIDDVLVNLIACRLEFVSELETLLRLVFDQIGILEELCEMLLHRGSSCRNLILVVLRSS